MEWFTVQVFVLSALLATCCGVNKGEINSDLVNSDVQRTVDLSTHLPKISSSITLENTGKSAVRSFLFAVSPAIAEYLSYLGASIKSGEDETKLTVQQTIVAGHEHTVFYKINLAESLDSGKQVTVDVETAFSHSLQPYPSQITQSEKQNVRFTDSVLFFSPYKTTTQKTSVICGSSTIESYTKVKPVSADDGTIQYGPYDDKYPFSQTEMVIHYENMTPFLAVTQLTRVIEVSHWGNVAVEETVDLVHTGAILKGPFSRYDYQRTQDGVSSVKSFKMVLPPTARDVYYRDEIGNISTSNLRDADDVVELELRPRFPLFGGWRTHYYIGYNVPSYQYLFNEGDQYMLKMRFVDHLFDDQVVDQMTLKIILPEGAKNPDFVTPFEVNRGDNELHYTYLDTIGRPVIVAHKSNLVEQHIQDFELKYTFMKLMLLQEPLLVVGAFYLLFLSVIIYVRMDFAITKDEASESRMRVASLFEQVQGCQDRRSALYQSYDDAINKFKSSKDLSSFNASRKKINADYNQLTQQITALLGKLKGEGSDAVEKVTELQKLDSAVKDQINIAMSYAEKLLAGKLQKQQYIESEAAIKSKKEEIIQKMENILATL